MLTPLFRSVLVATSLCAACLPCSVVAQTTTSQDALDALTPARQPAHAARHQPGAARANRNRTAHQPAHQVQPRQGVHRGAAHSVGGKVPAVAAAPPAAPVFTAPVINVPLHPPPPPPPVPVVPNAVGTVTPIDGGVRIGFGAGSADVNPATMQALHAFAATLKAAPDARAILEAAAAGSKEDPSTPRRLALSRGLAARAVLINDGIASTRIYVRMNPLAGAGSDHVDLRLERNDASTPADPPPAPGSTPP